MSSGLAWRAAAIKSGELFITRTNVRVSSSPSRAAALVEKLGGTLESIDWRKGILFAEGHWAFTMLGFRNDSGELFILSVILKEVNDVAVDPQEDGFTAVCQHLHVHPDGVERIDRYTPPIPWWTA